MQLDSRLLRAVRPVRVDLGLTVGLGVIAGAVLVGQAWYLSRVVSQVFLDGRTLGQVQAGLLAFLLLSLVRAGLVWSGEVAANRMAVVVKQDLRARLAARLMELGPAYVHEERSGELANTVTEGVEALDAYFRQYLPQVALAALVPLTVLFFVFPLDWPSGLVLLFTAPLLPLFMVLIGKMADAVTQRQWESLSRMSAHFLDMLQGLATLKMLDRSREQIRTIDRVSERYGQATMGVLRVAFLSALVLEMVATLSTALVAVQIGLRLLAGHLSFEQAFFVLILAPEFYLPLRTLGARFHAGIQGMAAAQRIFEVLGVKGSEQPAEASPSPGTDCARMPRLDLIDLHYAYDEGRRPALCGLSFRTAAGEKVALVGPSGAGKTTLSYLLLRFLEPQAGSVIVDGRPVREISPAAWRRRVAWVSQNPTLFHGTVAENIRLARPEATPSEIVRAAEQAQADPFIRALPQGYETLVGEQGVRLSGGEAQRIALARAFLKDAPLLILDEATAHLDPQTETLVREAIAHLVVGRTALIIAHRLTTVALADRIVVMDKGRVAEEGSHTALLRQGGLYSQMVAAHHQAGTDGQSLAEGRLQEAQVAGARQSEEDPHAAPRTAGARDLGEPAAREPMSDTAVFRRLLGLAWPYAHRMALAVLLGFATIGSSMGLMTTSAYLIAKAALRPSIAELQVAIVSVRAFGIARGVFRYLERYASHQTTFRLLARLRTWFYTALEPLAPARLWQYRSGDLLGRIVADVGTLENVFLRVIAPPVVALLVSVLAALIMGSFALPLALTLLSYFLLAGLGLPLLVGTVSKATGQQMVQLRSALYGTLVAGIQGVADLLATGQEMRYLARIRALSHDLGRVEGRMSRLAGCQAVLSGLLLNLSTLAVLLVAIPLVTQGRVDGVYLALLTMTVLSSFEATSPLPQAFQYLGNSLEAGRRLFEIVDSRPGVVDPERPVPVPAGSGLCVRNLCFSYEEGGSPALDGLAFDLPSGGKLAIVGPSGAGKSTLVNLLSRFWDYCQGEILVGGRELHEFAQEEWRRMVGVVSQRTHLFNGTVRDNLLMARPEASESEMVEAARQAQIHDFVQSLPQGYDTCIGEQGLRLSEGQRQRLSVARAILKAAPILILDEPTANLDALTECEVMAALRSLMSGHTTLLITHRLLGLEEMDEILVLQAGRIVERGRHRELLERGGLYRRMWSLQTDLLSLP